MWMYRTAGCVIDKESIPGLVKSANEMTAFLALTVQLLLRCEQFNLKLYSPTSPNCILEFTKLTLLVTMQNVKVGNYPLRFPVLLLFAIVVVIFKTSSHYSSYTKIIMLLPFIFIKICLQEKT